jgi:hypothetical protein
MIALIDNRYEILSIDEVMMLQNEEVKMLTMKDYCNSYLMMSTRKQKMKKPLSNDRMMLLAFFERERERERETEKKKVFVRILEETKLFDMIACFNVS